MIKMNRILNTKILKKNINNKEINYIKNMNILHKKENKKLYHKWTQKYKKQNKQNTIINV